MKKRMLALLLAVFCLAINISVTLADEQSTAETAEMPTEEKVANRTYLVDLEFENLTYGEYSKNNQVKIIENYGEVDVIDFTEIDPETDKRNVLMMDYDGNSIVYHCFPRTEYHFGEKVSRGKLTFETEAYITAAKFLQFDMQQGGTVVTGGFFSDSGTRAINIGSGNSSAIVPLNKWINIRHVVDFDDRVFSLHFGDKTVFENVSLTDDIQYLDAVDIFGFPEQNAMTVYVDKLKCYVDMPERGTNEEESRYSKTEEIMKNLGILKDLDNYSLESPLTRGRISQLLSRSRGVTDDEIDAYSGEEFADVGASNIYKRSIGYLTGLGWVHSDNGYFYPEKNVTMGQAAKWLCYLAGYNSFAERNGGYPFGYITTLSELGVLKGTELKYDDEMTEGDFILMLSRILETDIYTAESLGEEVILDKTKGHTVMAEYFNCREIEGIVTATGVTGLALAQGAVGDTQIQIDSVTYNAPKLGQTENLIGKRVSAYVVGEGSVGTNEVIFVETIKNEEIVIYDEKIVNVLDKKDYFEIEFLDEKDKSDYVTVSKNAYFLYNGIAYGDVLPKSYLKPTAGEIVLTDNNKDGEYEVASVYSYTYVAVQSVDTLTKRIFGQNDEVIILDNKSKVWDGYNDFDYAQLVEWDVLQVQKNLRGDITLLFLEDKIRGIVDAKGDSSVVIDEKEFHFSPALTVEEKADLTVGGTAYVYLDTLGRVCSVNQNAADMYETGYLIDIEEQKGFKNPIVKILSEMGDIEIYELSESFRYNGKKLSQINSVRIIDEEGGKVLDSTESISSLSDFEKLGRLLNADAFDKHTCLRTPEEVSDYISRGKISPDTIRQPVKYISRAGDIITAIDAEYYEVDKPVNHNVAERFYDYSQQIKGYCAISNDVIGFIIPEEEADDKDYGVVNWSTRHESDVWPEAYNMTESMVPEVLILYETNVSATVSTGSEPLFVEKAYKTLNKEGEEVYAFDGYERGEARTYMTEDTNIGGEVSAGDIIQILRNKQNEITAIEMRLKPSEKPDFVSDADFDKWVQINYGVIMAVEKGGITIASQNSGTKDAPVPTGILPYNLRSDLKLFLFDLTTNKVTKVSGSEISNYTFAKNPEVRVAARATAGRLEEVYVYYES